MNIERLKFNISLLGDASVGKTCMVNSLKHIPFDENQIATIGVDEVIDEAKFDNTLYKFKIFDTAGQERYRSIVTNTLQISDGFFLVFSIANRTSFERISFWINTIKSKVNINQKVLILIGNKIDMENERQVSHEEASDFAKKYKMKYFETSAKNGFRIEEAFHNLYEDIYNLNKELENPEDNDDDNNDNVHKGSIQLQKEQHIESQNKTKKKRKCFKIFQ